MLRFLQASLLVGVLFLTACSATKEISPLTAEYENLDESRTGVIVEATPDEFSQILGFTQMPNEGEYRGSDKKVNDLLHTKLEISLDWNNQHVLGKATLTFKPHFYPTSTLTLDAKGFDLHEVALVKDNAKKELEYTYDSRHISISLDKEYTRQDTYTIYIDYTAKPDELVLNDEDITYENKGLYFIDPLGTDPHKPTEVWTQGETESSSCWFPTIDSPNERTSQETYLTVSDKYVSLTNGRLVSTTDNKDGTHTDYWKQDIPHAPYLFAVIVGEYAVVRDEWKGKDVTYYVEPDYEPYARDIFNGTVEMLDLYSEMLDYEYPWDKYAQVVVRDFVAGAMENTGAVTFFEGMHQTKRELEDDNNEDIVAHELFHHWFGDLLTCESWSNLPLNEAFATYGEYLWFEHKYGRDAADYHIQRDLNTYLAEAENKQVPIFRYFYDHPDDMFDRHSYQKGGRVLHVLRKYIGDDAFFESMKVYVKDNAHQAVEIHDMRKAFEEVTGEDLNWFFDQWFLTAGHPELDIKHSYDEELQKVTVSIEQVQESGFVFNLPLAIDIYHADGTKERKHIVAGEQKSIFSFDAVQAPNLVNVDAEKMLLGTKTDHKTTETFAFQYRNAPLFLDRHEAVEALDEAQESSPLAVEVLVEALSDKFWAIRRAVLNRLKIENKAIAEKVKPILMEMAENDEKSLVRAAALAKLSEMNDKAMAPLFEKKLDDPSYTVIATALSGIYELNDKSAIELAKNMEEEKNSMVVNVIAKIYSEKGDADREQFFAEKLANPSLYDRYTLIEYFRDFLNRTGDKTVENGLPILQNIALDDSQWWVRLNATQAISNIRDVYFEKKKLLEDNAANDESSVMLEIRKLENRLADINQMLEGIKSSEKNERLKVYYQHL